MAYKIKRYGWIRDIPDQRDHLYAAPFEFVAKLPPKVDLRPHCPPVYDQGQLGSCTANAIAAAIEFDQLKQNLPHPGAPSRLFIYYNERAIEGTIASDSGAQIRDGIKSVSKQGACPESEWPYDIQKFEDKPTAKCFQDAAEHKIKLYQRLTPNLTQLQGCLASGFPFVFGFTVYESFESQELAHSGVVPMPASGEQVLGGHAVMAAGYDESKSSFLVRNSWGTGWGMKGYFLMPFAYLTRPDLSSDFWTIHMTR
jgi:C1A family cysteine protease